jgi:hypothetical protein
MGLMQVVNPDINRQPRYDEIYDSARELEASVVPFTSALIQPEAVRALQRMPTVSHSNSHFGGVEASAGVF